VPAGTLRHEVCGRDRAPATAEQRARMAALVATGMAEGALGLSTGLDYVPGIFQSAGEIAALCGPVARAGGVYVSHMRGGYEANAAAGIAEIIEIAELTAAAAGSPLPVHVSHFHADADIVLAQLARLERAGVDATFDAYPYTRGCTLLSMPLLPHELSAQPVDDVVHALTDPVGRPQLRAACLARATQSPSLGPDWPRLVTLAHLAAPEYAWAHGLTLHEAGRRAGVYPMDLALDALAACRLEASAIMAVRHARPSTELARIFAHPRHTAGSDGIFIGAHPHPRASGTFARYLREFVLELGTWSWPTPCTTCPPCPLRGSRWAPAEPSPRARSPISSWSIRTRSPTPRRTQNRVAPPSASTTCSSQACRCSSAASPPALFRAAGCAATGMNRTEKGNRTVAKTGVHTTNAPRPAGPYSQGIVANGLMYTAGFGPQDPADGNAVADNVADQTRQVLRNIQAVLAERGLTLDDCLKTTVHLADLADFAEFNAAYRSSSPSPTRCAPPSARSWRTSSSRSTSSPPSRRTDPAHDGRCVIVDSTRAGTPPTTA
jgi:N-acyl-D-amino-acid deacylase